MVKWFCVEKLSKNRQKDNIVETLFTKIIPYWITTSVVAICRNLWRLLWISQLYPNRGEIENKGIPQQWFFQCGLLSVISFINSCKSLQVRQESHQAEKCRSNSALQWESSQEETKISHERRDGSTQVLIHWIHNTKLVRNLQRQPFVRPLKVFGHRSEDVLYLPRSVRFKHITIIVYVFSSIIQSSGRVRVPYSPNIVESGKARLCTVVYVIT